jgi:neurotransmitter:Na+ symporter, NSS family
MQPAQRDSGAPGTPSRGQWGSKLGFILAAAGSAVGLGNIWRFPYMTGENGGAAFVLVYLLCVFLIGLPIMYAELALGRASGRNVIGAFRVTRPGTPFIITGVFCLACCFFVLSYYGVIAGWTLGYAIASAMQKKVVFEEFAANPKFVLPLFGFFIFITILIVQGGVRKGIERWAKVLMPALFVLCFVVILRSITLEGASEGIKYYLHPDFSKINGTVVLKALGQAFFSLSVGWGLMITYGSYMPRSQNIVQGGFWVAITDTSVALIGGFMVFPAVFAFGMAPDAGTALTFKTLPAVFEQMPAGALVAATFFVLLGIAALTSTISMLEVPVSWLVDEKGISRKFAAWLVGGAAFVVGIPSALSAGAVEWLTEINLGTTKGFLGIMDLIFGTAIILIISLLVSVYAGWVWRGKPQEEISLSSGFSRPLIGRVSQATLWTFFIRFICPAVIVIVLLDMVGIKIF